MYLRPGAAAPDEERLARQIGPNDGGSSGKSMPVRQSRYARQAEHDVSIPDQKRQGEAY